MRWEHRTVRVEGDGPRELTHNLNDAMHQLEVLGWELVSVCTTNAGNYRLFFKRQVEE